MTGEINLGKQVTDELRDNHNIDWRFYDSEEEALEATRRFECYAALVMPKDLSKNVVGIFEGSNEQPAIYFYPNEKQNAVAVKVSDSAAQTLVTQINQQFASTVNEAVLEKVQEGANKVDEQASQTRRTLASEVDDTQAQIANVTQSLDSTIDAINGWRESVAGSQASLSSAAQQLPTIRNSLAESSATLNDLRVETIAFDSVFSKSLSQTNLALANLSLRISANMSATESDVARVSADLDKSIELMSAELDAHGPNEVTEQLKVALQKLQSASDHLESAVALADASTQNMNANVQNIVDKTNAANDTFSREVLPALSNGTYDLGTSLSGLSSAVGQFEPQIVELQEVLAQTDEHFKNQTINDLFSVAPPLPSSLVSPAAPNGSSANESEPTEQPKRYGGAARDIFFTDMRVGFQSVIGVVVIMLLVITPSLYAWFNIAGCWDPYSNTGNLKVAVANEDAGYKSELIPVRVNVGDTIVAQLRSNDSFNWVFVDEQQAVDGVTDSSYYAAIVIPEDFSQNMMTYLTDGAKYPDVVYYTNEKENPIAPIITQKGADSIQEGIRRTFTERVDETALALAADLSEYISRPEVGTYLNKMAGHLDDAVRDLRNGAYELRSLSSLSGTVSNVVTTAGSTMNGVRTAGETARSAVASAETGAQSATAAFDQASAVIEAALADSETELGSIAYDIDGALAALEASTTEVPASIHEAANVAAGAGNAMHETARVTREAAELLTDETEREKMLAEAKRIDAIGDSYDTLSSSISTMASRSENLGPNIEQTRAELTQLVADADAAIAEARTYYNDNVKSSANSMWSTIETTSTSVHSIVDGLDTAIGGLVNSTDGLNGQLTSLESGLAQASTDLDEASSRLSNTKKNLSDALASGDLNQIKAIALSSDVENLADRLSAPLEINRQPIYPVANFGSQMASFYTVLSLWVGALVTISAMRVRIVEERLEQLRLHYRTVRTRHEFFGRYGIFGFIALLQSVLVLLGDLMLLHIQCDNPIMFMVLGVFIGQVFCLFVYTMTELFGNVGKALCVILLIMQVAASGGTFPVEMLDPLLSSIVPYLPFYHGMCLLKECVAGIYWPAVVTNAAFLAIAVGILLLVGIVIRRPFRIADDWLERQLEKTGFM